MLNRLASRTLVQRRFAGGLNGLPEGWPGSNLPVRIDGSTMAGRIKFTLKYSIALALPFWFPFFIMKYHLQRANAS